MLENLEYMYILLELINGLMKNWLKNGFETCVLYIIYIIVKVKEKKYKRYIMCWIMRVHYAYIVWDDWLKLIIQNIIQIIISIINIYEKGLIHYII